MWQFWSLRNRHACFLDRVDFLISLMFISRGRFPLSEGGCLLKSTFSLYEKKIYIFKALCTVWKLDEIYLLGPLKCMAKTMKNSTRCISHIFNLITNTGIWESKDDFPSSFFVLGMLAFVRDIHISGSESFMLFRAILCLLNKACVVVKSYWIFLSYICWPVERTLGITWNIYVVQMFHCSIDLFKVSWIVPKYYSKKL